MNVIDVIIQIITHVFFDKSKPLDKIIHGKICLLSNIFIGICDRIDNLRYNLRLAYQLLNLMNQLISESLILLRL